VEEFPPSQKRCGRRRRGDVGPNYNGKLRAIDVETLRKVGEMIKHPTP
jgi:hypothetical protein